MDVYNLCSLKALNLDMLDITRNQNGTHQCVPKITYKMMEILNLSISPPEYLF